MEARRQDPDDFQNPSSKRDFAADYLGVSPKLPPPDCIAQDRDNITTRPAVFGLESASQLHRCAEHVKQVGRGDAGANLLWIAFTRKLRSRYLHGDERFDLPRLVLQNRDVSAV